MENVSQDGKLFKPIVWKNYFEPQENFDSQCKFIIKNRLVSDHRDSDGSEGIGPSGLHTAHKWKNYFDTELDVFPSLENVFAAKVKWISWDDLEFDINSYPPRRVDHVVNPSTEPDDNGFDDSAAESAPETPPDSPMASISYHTHNSHSETDLLLVLHPSEDDEDEAHLQTSKSALSLNTSNDILNMSDPEDLSLASSSEEPLEQFILSSDKPLADNPPNKSVKLPSYYTEKRYEWLSPAFIAAFSEFNSIFTTNKNKHNLKKMEEMEIKNEPQSCLFEPKYTLPPAPAPLADFRIISPKILIDAVPRVKCQFYSPDRTLIRPHSSQGLLSLSQPNLHQNRIEGPFLLQVPSVGHYTKRKQTNHPHISDEKSLPAVRKVKTPPGLLHDSKFWAEKRNSSFNFIPKSTTKKLKKIPKNYRSKSAQDKPNFEQDFSLHRDVNESFDKGSRTHLLHKLEGSSSSKRFAEVFRFSKQLTSKVSPDNSTSRGKTSGIHSKVERTVPKSLKNTKTRGKRSMSKRKNWIPVIKNLLRGSLVLHKHAKVSPFMPRSLSTLGLSGNSHFNKEKSRVDEQEKHSVFKLVDYRAIWGPFIKNGLGNPNPKKDRFIRTTRAYPTNPNRRLGWRRLVPNNWNLQRFLGIRIRKP